MDSQANDIDLIRRIKRREQAALTALYARYGGPVYSFALRVLQNAAQAEEVTQDIFLRVWERADQWDPAKGKLSSWLLTMTRYAAIDRIRRENRRPPLAEPELDDLPQLVANPDRNADDGRILRNLLQQLPPEQSQLIQLAFFGGMSHSELAESLQIPLGTVKTRIRLGLQKLRELWLNKD